MNSALFRVSIIGVVAVALGATGAVAWPQGASAVESGSLSSTANPSRFLGRNPAGYWVDNSLAPGSVQYPSVGETGPIIIDGTCVPFEQGADDPGIIGVAAASADCLNFRAAVVSDTRFTFQVDDPQAATHGRFLGEGSGGFSLDLLSTAPVLLFNAPRSVSGELAATLPPAPDPVLQAGAVVQVSVIAKNTGNTAWTSVSVVDGAGLAVSCPAGPVPAGETLACTQLVTITQAMLDNSTAFRFEGTATDAVGTTGILAPAQVAVDYGRPTGALTALFAPVDLDAVGDVAPISVTVTNTGNVTLNAVGVDDANCPVGSLTPTASITCERDVIVTQADLDRGVVEASFSAHASTSSGQPIDILDVAAQASVLQRPSAALAVIPGATTGAPGEVVSYEAIVTNTGNVSASGVRLEGQTCETSFLAPGESAHCSGSVQIPADAEAGPLLFSVTASAQFAGSDIVIEPVAIRVTVTRGASLIDPATTPDTTAAPGADKRTSGKLATAGVDLSPSVLVLGALLTLGASAIAFERGHRAKRAHPTSRSI